MKITWFLVLPVVVLIGLAFSVPAQAKWWYYQCPSDGTFSGWWKNISLVNEFCRGQVKYTWNTQTELKQEESSFVSKAHYIACRYSSFRDPGIVDVKTFVPWSDSKQTNKARYYKWSNYNNYRLIGTVDQYHAFGWVGLSSVDWDPVHQLKLTDWTSEAKYTRHVDMDAYMFTCP